MSDDVIEARLRRAFEREASSFHPPSLDGPTPRVRKAPRGAARLSRRQIVAAVAAAAVLVVVVAGLATAHGSRASDHRLNVTGTGTAVSVPSSNPHSTLRGPVNPSSPAARCAAATTALLIAGCGAATAPPASSMATQTTSPAPTAPPAASTPSAAPQTTTTTVAATTACAASNLHISFVTYQGAAGTGYYSFDVVNASSTSCEIGGYFGVTIYSTSGQQISDHATDVQSQSGGGATPVALAPGATASFDVQVLENGTGCPDMGSFGFIPPNATTTAQVTLTRPPGSTPDCGGPGVSPTKAGAAS